MVTRGGEKGWVTSYNVKYSLNQKEWNPIVDENGNEKQFLANINENAPHINHFDMPINARYIKIVPRKWHDRIQMRAEVIGCYKPYPEIGKNNELNN